MLARGQDILKVDSFVISIIMGARFGLLPLDDIE